MKSSLSFVVSVLRRGLPKVTLVAALGALVSSAACNIDTVPERLGPAPVRGGPEVVFDPVRRPLPAIPLPNDFATFADPTSRTGRRINVSLVAPTQMEERARRDFSTLEGWGLTAPISVQFSRSSGQDERLPALDLDDLQRRMQNDDFDFANDPVYLVDLTTGVPVFLDAGSGAYPVTVRDPFKYFPNDPKANEPNIVFETVEEGAGLPQSAYTPALDLDFDGVLDHPNTLDTPFVANGSRASRGIPKVDDVLTFYERETDTLILRPLLPLDERHEYAVVITDRLRGQNRKPVASPFENVYHPQQRGMVSRVEDVLRDPRLARYYGDLSGSGLDHVAFTWSFTTQPVAEDMHALRNGLYGKGVFSRFATQFPPDAHIFPAGGLSDDPAAIPGWKTENDACRKRASAPFVIRPNDPDVRATFELLFAELFGFSKGQVKALLEAYQYIDHFVVGSFKSPFLMGDPRSKDPDTRFDASFATGEATVTTDEVPFYIVVPKRGAGVSQPFPVALWGHGVTGHADEVLLYAGDFARQGISIVAYDNPEHGAVLSVAQRIFAQAKLRDNCLVPWITAFEKGRARDVNGDGLPDSGFYWWTSHIFHTRDNLRQGLLDGMQFLRVLRAFDGQKKTDQDFNGDGRLDLAGDFDGDGIPDIGGPGVKYYASGESLGGIMAELQGGVEPLLTATAPISGGGSLAMDVGFRSYGVVDSVMGQVMGPFVVAVPAEERAEQKRDKRKSACAKGERSLRLHVNDGVDGYEMEVACLRADELDAGMTVLVTNVRSKEKRCARAGTDGRLRIPIPTTEGDRLDVQVYPKTDAVTSYGTCEIVAGAEPGRRIGTFERAITEPLPVADGDATKCTGDAGCAQFRDRFFSVGSDLVAPNDGLGLRRQSPELRRLRDLAQIGVDAADPSVYAPYYFRKALLDENERPAPPRALLSTNTVGDNFVQVAAGLSFARAAGVLPFLPPQALEKYREYADFVTPQDLYEKLGRRTPFQLLVTEGVTEGIARLARVSAGPMCKGNFKPKSEICKGEGQLSAEACKNALYDADWVSEGKMGIDQAHPAIPLRLARTADTRVSDATTLARAWAPRLTGAPFSADERGWTSEAPVVALFNHYLEPGGAHTWNVGDVCETFDTATYGNALLARFFASEGKDVYYLSHPSTHGCLADGTCPFLRKSP